ncbi:MAG: hypothetical protein AAGA56_11600, partial [Myxococcota bacterium]
MSLHRLGRTARASCATILILVGANSVGATALAQTSPAGEAKRDRPGDGLARARSLLREAGVKASLLEGVAEQSRTAARRARAA